MWTDDERAMLEEIRRLRAVVREYEAELLRLDSEVERLKEQCDYYTKLLNGR